MGVGYSYPTADRSKLLLICSSSHSLCVQVELAVENDFKQHLAIQCGSEREIKNRKLYKVCLAYNLSHRFLCSDDGFK
jgi:hypothetical protein